MEPAPFSSDGQPDATQKEVRIYAPEAEAWKAHIKVGWDKEYCYSKFPGQDYLHLLLNGEIYLQSKDEKLCLTCALRKGILTEDRLYWQNKPRVTSIPIAGL
jgi:hypothetical protein